MKQAVILKGEWRKLLMMNYEADPALLVKYVPAYTELDNWNGRHFVSLVGFLFQDTRFLGVKVPFHINFPEINLRIYLRRINDKKKKGVLFIREFIQKPAITVIANNLYREHYKTIPIKHTWLKDESGLVVNYSWKNNAEWNVMEAGAGLDLYDIEAGSEEEFLTQREWGFSPGGENKTFEYRVTHPMWQLYPLKYYNLNCDFGKIYGEDFAFMNMAGPSSVLLAEGSAIKIYNKQRV